MAFVSLSLASALSAASLDLCSDEYLLLLARPGEVVSVSRLAKDPDDSPLWKVAQAIPGNRGSLEDVVAARPRLVLTMGGGPRSTATIARRLGIRVVNLPFPASIADVEANFLQVATALGDRRRADLWLARIGRLKASAPHVAKDAIFLSGGGNSLSSGSVGSQWMRLAGYAQRPIQGGRVTLETLVINPPKTLIRSDYRSGQLSAGQRWLEHPFIRRLEARTIRTDGRRWTCAGPLMIAEIERLKGLKR